MIKVNGKDSGTGIRYVLIVLNPEQMKDLRGGATIAVDIQRGHQDVVSAPLEVVIEGPRAFKRRAKELADAAATQGIAPKRVSKMPRRRM